MNCPYCDQTIHPQAKFCAKCGLPLKEDITNHGVSAGDDTGASKYVIAAMLAGIVIIGGAIAILGSQKSGRPTEVTVRPPVGGYQRPGTAGLPGTAPVAPAFSGQQQNFGARRADPNTSSVTRYAYTPPAVPATPAMNAPVTAPAPIIAPPPPLIAMARADAAKPTRVVRVETIRPPIPSLPDSVANAAMPPSIAEDAAATLPATSETPDLSRYVWDPVHERWALRPEARRQRANARNRNSRSRVRSAPAGRAGRVPYFYESPAPGTVPPASPPGGATETE